MQWIRNAYDGSRIRNAYDDTGALVVPLNKESKMCVSFVGVYSGGIQKSTKCTSNSQNSNNLKKKIK